MEAQAQFVESWSETVGEASDDTEISDASRATLAPTRRG